MIEIEGRTIYRAMSIVIVQGPILSYISPIIVDKYSLKFLKNRKY